MEAVKMDIAILQWKVYVRLIHETITCIDCIHFFRYQDSRDSTNIRIFPTIKEGVYYCEWNCVCTKCGKLYGKSMEIDYNAIQNAEKVYDNARAAALFNYAFLTTKETSFSFTFNKSAIALYSNIESMGNG